MADNVTITGTTIAADDIAGVQFQRTKLVWGVDGTAVDASASNPLPVQGTVTVDSEFPTAAALADATANPTTTKVGSFCHVYNGTTWDRIRGDTTNGIDVDVTRVQGTVTVDSELITPAALADGVANPTVTSVGVYNSIYNGTTWERVRTISWANATAGQGVAATAPMAWDETGIAYRRLRMADQDALSGQEHQAVAPTTYNGTNHDRVRGNLQGTLLASAARTTTTTSPTQTNHNARGAIVAVRVTTAGTGFLNVKICWLDPVSSEVILLDSSLFATAEITPGTGAFRYAVFPGADVGNVTGFKAASSLPLPRSWYVTVTPSNGSSWTYGVYYSLIV